MNNQPQVLVVEDQTLDDYLASLYSDEYDLTGVRSLKDAISALEQAALEQRTFDVVLTDLELFDRPDGGMRVAEKAKSLDATTAVFLVTVHSNEPTARRAITELGAAGFFPKPLDIAACRSRIHKAILDRRYQWWAIKAADQGGFVPIASPYVPGKPLGPGNTLFYGRDQVFDFIRNSIIGLDRHSHLRLVGPRRIGKTSILKQLPARWNPPFFSLVHINCQLLGIDTGLPAFFLQLARQVRRNLEGQETEAISLPTLTPADLGDEYAALNFYERFLDPLNQSLGKRRLLLCLDEFEELVSKVERGRLDERAIEFLHSLMLDETIVCILAGTRRLNEMGRICRPAADIVNMTTHYQVGLLSYDQARCLIEEPVAYSGMCYQNEAIAAIWRATGGYPYLIQLLCSKLVNQRNEQRRNEMSVGDVQIAIDTLLETPHPGFFWESLTPFQQIVLIAACQLWQHQQVITTNDVERQLQALDVSWHKWEMPVQSLLHELSLEELLQERIIDGQHHEYRLTFELLSAWVRRHKTLNQVQEEMDHDR